MLLNLTVHIHVEDVKMLYSRQIVQVDSCYNETINDSLVDVFRNGSMHEITRALSLLNAIIEKKKL